MDDANSSISTELPSPLKFQQASTEIQRQQPMTTIMHANTSSMAWLCFSSLSIIVGCFVYIFTVVFLLALTNVSDEQGFHVFGVHFPHFQTQARTLFAGLSQALLFGWLYGLVVIVWERAHVPYVFCFAIQNESDNSVVLGDHDDPSLFVGSIPFLPQRYPFHSRSQMRLRKRLATSSVDGVLVSEQQRQARAAVITQSVNASSSALDELEMRSSSIDRPHDHTRVFSLCTFLSFCLGASVASYTLFTSYSNRGHTIFPAALFPVSALLIFFLYFLVPLLPASGTRLSLGAVLGQVVLAPLFGVHFVHVMVADALTSASLPMWELETSACFIFSGGFLYSGAFLPNKHNDCGGTSIHKIIMEPVMVALPFWLRFVQCWYKYFTTWKTENVVNAGKYFSAILVVLTSTLHADLDEPNSGWTPLYISWAVAIVVKTLYCFVWDIRMDWDLGHVPAGETKGDRTPLLTQNASHTYKQSTFPLFLRAERLYRATWVYYVAMFTNLCLRCSWTVALSVRSNLLPPSWTPILALLEIVRRAQWMVFRVEREVLSRRNKMRNK